ncbi:MAG: PIN domain-containing protein [Candidatus Methanoperedens sp.]|nr:PIN domain-containing protein [Candidatus Methanoperedens sp.]MCZ7396783.1 PIN domain-containing protein [Candidatus Methanoperedens sp.]
MDRILIDTMHLAKLFKDDSYLDLAGAITDGDIEAICSVISLTELTKRLGMIDEERMRKTRQELLSSRLIFVNVTRTIAMRAGDLRLRYDIPTVDSVIAATGVVENIRNILTDDTRHFEATKNLIKPIDLKAAMKLV